MVTDDGFLRAIWATPGDPTPRLAYADWLDERGDGRGAYLRLGELRTPVARRRQLELRPALPAGWLPALGDYAAGPDPERFNDDPADSPFGATAFVEQRPSNDYFLVVRDGSRLAEWELTTYNPVFGVMTGFLGWFGHVVVLVYSEKHRFYAARLGVDSPAECVILGHKSGTWRVDGPHLAFGRHDEATVRRFAIPSLAELPPLSPAEAEEWGLRLDQR